MTYYCATCEKFVKSKSPVWAKYKHKKLNSFWEFLSHFLRGHDCYKSK